MNRQALASIGSKAAWTALQAGVGVISAPDLISALGLPKRYQGLAVVVVAYLLSHAKNFLATRFGDPTTTTFDGPLRTKKYPLVGLPIEQLADVARFAYANVDGVSLVGTHDEDPIPDHGVNGPGETD